MDIINEIVAHVSNYLYSYILIILLVGGGIYFSIRTKFSSITHIKEQFKLVTEKPKDKKGVSSFQALMVSTASRVGTGNIVGVASAICIGGFGSVFWMWIIALIGGASALVESVLAQIFKKRGTLGCYGGPAYYIEKAFKTRVVAVIFSILLILTYGVGFNMLASFNLQSTFTGYSFYNPKVTPWIIGAIVACLVAYCLFGGGKRILKVTSFLVPIMGVLYILIALIMMFINIASIPTVFAEIFKNAFNFRAIFGGIASSCLMLGIKRGLFSNEAGVGSAPNASASADVTHPVKQGLVQVLSVFIDTIVICSATAFMCMCSGVEITEAMKLNPISYIQAALGSIFGDFGLIFLTVAMILFAFTTLLGNLFYVDKAFNYILKRDPSKTFKRVFYVIFSLLILFGAVLNSDLLWNFSDVLMGLMALINIPALFILGKFAFKAIKDYDKQRKLGKDPVFLKKDIDLPYETDYWQ